MRCPYCKANNDRVVDSRTSGEADVIRRRRECLECGGRFTTYEKAGEATLRVVKKDGTRVPFDRDKLLRGLHVACHKRPVETETLESIVTDIESQLHEVFDKEVASKYIGHLVMDALRSLDQVAYVRFASVYREFKDVNQFLDELKPLLGSGEPGGESPLKTGGVGPGPGPGSGPDPAPGAGVGGGSDPIPGRGDFGPPSDLPSDLPSMPSDEPPEADPDDGGPKASASRPGTTPGSTKNPRILRAAAATRAATAIEMERAAALGETRAPKR